RPALPTPPGTRPARAPAPRPPPPLPRLPARSAPPPAAGPPVGTAVRAADRTPGGRSGRALHPGPHLGVALAHPRHRLTRAHLHTARRPPHRRLRRPRQRPR